jgi:hypothetical protein
MAALLIHNPQVGGSTPPITTKKSSIQANRFGWPFCWASTGPAPLGFSFNGLG